MSALKEHWGTKKHKLLDTKYRLSHGLPLLDVEDRPLSADAVAEAMAEVASLPVPVIEPNYGVSLSAVLEIERSERDVPQAINYSSVGAVSMSTERAEKLWFAKVVECVRRQRSIDDLVSSWYLIQSSFSEFSYMHDLPMNSSSVMVIDINLVS